MHRQRFITNTVFLFGTGMVAQVVGLLVLPLFIRNLGEEMYGLFVISNMLMGYVGLLDFGFTDGLTRQIGRAHASGDRQSVSDAVSTGFWLLVGVGLLAGLLIYFGRFVFLDFLNVTGPDRGVGADLLTVTAVFSMLQWPMRLPQAILKATLHIKQFSIVQASFAVVASFAMLALVLLSFDVVGIRLGVCLVLAASWVPQVLLVRRCLPDLAWNPFRFRREAFLGMSGFSLGMFYTRVLSLLSSRVDHLIIGAMISVGTIPAYVVAEAWRRLTVRATGNLFGAVMPTVFSLDTDANRKKLQTLLDGAVRYRALLISPLAHLGIVMSPAFIRTWMGAEYAPYAIWSQLFMVPVLTTVFGVATNIARGIGKLKICNSILTVRVILNVTLSIALIPVFGVGAPILGTVVAQTVLGDLVTMPFFCRICNLRSRKALSDGILIILANAPVTAAGVLALQFVKIDTWIPMLAAIAGFALVFYVTLLVLFVRREEKEDMMRALDAMGIGRIPKTRAFIVRCLNI